jgi:hypothetical protein
VQYKIKKYVLSKSDNFTEYVTFLSFLKKIVFEVTENPSFFVKKMENVQFLTGT